MQENITKWIMVIILAALAGIVIILSIFMFFIMFEKFGFETDLNNGIIGAAGSIMGGIIAGLLTFLGVRITLKRDQINKLQNEFADALYVFQLIHPMLHSISSYIKFYDPEVADIEDISAEAVELCRAADNCISKLRSQHELTAILIKVSYQARDIFEYIEHNDNDAKSDGEKISELRKRHNAFLSVMNEMQEYHINLRMRSFNEEVF